MCAHRETPEERKKFEKERVAEVLGTLRKSKSIAKKRSADVAKKLEVFSALLRKCTCLAGVKRIVISRGEARGDSRGFKPFEFIPHPFTPDE